MKNRVSILTDVLVLPIEFLDDLDFRRNEKITNAYHVSHESGSSTNGKKSFVQYNFRRKNRSNVVVNQVQEENKQEDYQSNEEEQKEYNVHPDELSEIKNEEADQN